VGAPVPVVAVALDQLGPNLRVILETVAPRPAMRDAGKSQHLQDARSQAVGALPGAGTHTDWTGGLLVSGYLNPATVLACGATVALVLSAS
jgi:hypothetical protein